MRAVVSLTRAALRLGLGYHAARDMLLRGELHGGIDARGRYLVDAEGLERIVRERQGRANKSREQSPAA